MKFDFVIGNPPYQEEAPGQSTSDKPVYHLFMDAASSVGDVVELVTPARFLFNAGATPKKWNEKMLLDKHFRILLYEQDATAIFPGTFITGGIAISTYNKNKEYKPIRIFVPYAKLRSIIEKVENISSNSLNNIISGRTPYLFTDALHKQYPNAITLLSKGHKYDISSNAFQSLPDIFLQSTPYNKDEYYRCLGRKENQRVYCWIKKEFAKGRLSDYVTKWKVFLPKANGASGMLGKNAARLISKPVVGEPNDIATDTFICVGTCDTKFEATAIYKYVLSKFARALLGTLKVTQINSKETWANVPLQDFTPNSDIDWSKPIPQIDQQLYKKYGLDQSEIDFIETHVKEMA